MSKTFTKLNRFTAFPQARSDKSSGSCSSSSNSSTTSSPVGGERQNVETFEEFAPMVRRWNMDEDGRESKNIIESKDLPIGYIPPAEKIALRELSKKDEAKERLATNEKVYQSAMTTAQAPGGQLFMTAFMMWMSGSTLQIFSIFFLSMAFMTPLRAIMNANQDPVIFFPVGLNYFPLCYVAEFAKYAESKVDVTVPYLIYILLNCVGVGLALYKCQTLGLLPSEWGAIATAPTNLEFSVGSATPRS